MRNLRAIVIVAALCVQGCETTPDAIGPPVAARASSPAWPTLSRFSSESEFLEYLRAVRDAQSAARERGAAKQDENCDPLKENCHEESEEDVVVVTGSRIAQPSVAAASPVTQASAENITNVQNAGVDEGDIVKLVGRFLVVLQDGRLFSVDLGANAGDLRFADRINVYRHSGEDAWYDELLTTGNRLVVTGFNYGAQATEFAVFSIDENGQFTREGAYFLSSNDYYDTENYASRLVDGNLVIYTPLDVSELDPDDPPVWPIVRRWVGESPLPDEWEKGRRLFEASDIYRPIQSTLDPTIHTISVCPLGSPRAGDELECRSTAVVGPAGREFYVSTSHIYLWVWPTYRWNVPASCEASTPAEFDYAAEGALFQIDIHDGAARAQFVRGRPYDQLSMDASGQTSGQAFQALSVWVDQTCDRDLDDLPLRFLSTPLSQFSVTPRAAPASAYTSLPSPDGTALENRFTDAYLVYGGRSSWNSYAPEEGQQPRAARVVAVPRANPAAFTSLQAPHNVIRVERAGNNAVLAGYRDDSGLNISLLDLRAAPRIANTALLEGRFESEGRSHAFNSAIGADGAGLMGIPTVLRQGESGRWWWRSQSSDLSYLTVDAAGALRSIGSLDVSENPQDPSYRCQVSCIDWYGNSRPIFIGARVFALSGVELIEGQVRRGAIAELRRVNLSAPPPRSVKR